MVSDSSLIVECALPDGGEQRVSRQLGYFGYAGAQRVNESAVAVCCDNQNASAWMFIKQFRKMIGCDDLLDHRQQHSRHSVQNDSNVPQDDPMA
jgi:hypothetical protein